MLPEANIKKIVSDVMQGKFGSHGLIRSDVDFEDDFDGEPIVRVKALFENDSAESETLFEAATTIRAQLKVAGDDRFVFVQRSLSHQIGEESDDEDMGGGGLP